MLVETSDEEGTSAQIIYRNGGMVDARSLEELCDKVCTDHDWLFLAIDCAMSVTSSGQCDAHGRWVGRGGHRPKWRLR